MARAATYDPKLAVDGTFQDIIKISVNYNVPKKDKKKSRAVKKKKK